jgi:hypothetical protein
LNGELLKDSVRLECFCEEVSNIAVAWDMGNIDKFSNTGIANGDFTDVEVAKLLGNSASCSPIDAASVIIEKQETEGSVTDIGRSRSVIRWWRFLRVLLPSSMETILASQKL